MATLQFKCMRLSVSKGAIVKAENGMRGVIVRHVITIAYHIIWREK